MSTDTTALKPGALYRVTWPDHHNHRLEKRTGGSIAQRSTNAPLPIATKE